MPRRPLVIELGPYRYQIRSNIPPRSLPRDADGLFDARHSAITIRSGLAPDVARTTLMHEVLHALCDAEHLDTEWEEAMCRALAAPLVDLLRRNPTLVDYLQGRQP